MKIVETLDALGEFWLPGTPEKKITGILKIKENGKITLTALGRLSKKFEKNFPIIHGELNGCEITLIEAICRDDFQLIFNKTLLNIGYVFIGYRFLDINILTTNISFSMDGIYLLSLTKGLKSTSKDNGHVFSYTKKDNMTLLTKKDFSIYLNSVPKFKTEINNTHRECTIYEKHNLNIIYKKEIELKKILRAMHVFSMFMNTIGSFRTHIYNINFEYNEKNIKMYSWLHNKPYLEKYIYTINDSLLKIIHEKSNLILSKWFDICDEHGLEIYTFLLAKYELDSSRSRYIFLDIMKSIESFFEKNNEKSITNNEIKKKSKIIYDGIKSVAGEEIIDDIENFTRIYLKKQYEKTLSDKISNVLTLFFNTIFEINTLPSSAILFIEKIIKTRNVYTHLATVKKGDNVQPYQEDELLEVSKFLIVLMSYSILTELLNDKECVKQFVLERLKRNKKYPKLIFDALEQSKTSQV